MSSCDVEQFEAHAPEADLEDLRARLTAARLPEAETVWRPAPDPRRWEQGVPLADLVDLAEYWRTDHDWRWFETRVNEIGQYRTMIDDLGIHFLHRRSARADAVPLILTHGWPGSIAEFVDVVDELAEPDDQALPAFHVVVPSLPGFGYSDKPTTTGWGTEKIAAAWVELMGRLGYDRFVAYGGDWGGVITTILGGRFPEQVLGIHTTTAQGPPGLRTDGLSGTERAWAEATRDFWLTHSAYAKQQATRPQTIGYSLVDSPVGLLAWLLDKFAEWTDSHDSLDPDLRVDVPAAITIYPADIEKCPRTWAQQRYRQIARWEVADRGGHFPSLEAPDYFVRDLREGLAAVLAARL